MIVKVQAPISTNRRELVYLLYAEGKKHFIEQAPDEELIKKMNGRLRVYFEGTFYKHSGWVIHTEVEDQPW